MSASTVVEERLQARKLRKMSAPTVAEERLQTRILSRTSAPIVVEERLQTRCPCCCRMEAADNLDRIRR